LPGRYISPSSLHLTFNLQIKKLSSITEHNETTLSLPLHPHTHVFIQKEKKDSRTHTFILIYNPPQTPSASLNFHKQIRKRRIDRREEGEKKNHGF
jgi:hypothetical protein